MTTQTTIPTTAEIIDRLKSALGVSTDTEVAESLSITPNTLAVKKTRNSSILDEVLHLAQRENIDLNGLLLSVPKKAKYNIILQDEKGSKVDEIRLSKQYMQSVGLVPESLLVFKQENGDLHIVDTRVQKIIASGIYAISTDNGTLLKRAILRLDGSVVFPNTSPKNPEERLEKSDVSKLRIIGRTALMLAPPD